MIAAIIIGLLVGWIYTMIMKAGWTIKMPKQVPPAVSNQFTAMIPSGIILTGSMLIYGTFNAFAHTDFFTILCKFLFKVFQTHLVVPLLLVSLFHSSSSSVFTVV